MLVRLQFSNPSVDEYKILDIDYGVALEFILLKDIIGDLFKDDNNHDGIINENSSLPIYNVGYDHMIIFIELINIMKKKGQDNEYKYKALFTIDKKEDPTDLNDLMNDLYEDIKSYLLKDIIVNGQIDIENSIKYFKLLAEYIYELEYLGQELITDVIYRIMAKEIVSGRTRDELKLISGSDGVITEEELNELEKKLKFDESSDDEEYCCDDIQG